MTLEELNKALASIEDKKSWPNSLKLRAAAVVHETYELETVITAGRLIPMTSLEKPKSMMEVGRAYKRLGEAYQSLAQTLTFALLREPKNGNKTTEAETET